MKKKIGTLSYMPLQLLGYGFFKLYFRLKGIGVENVPKDGPCIIAPNHASYIDPPLVAAVTPRLLHFIMLYEHYYHPWFHWLFKRLPCIPVKQGRINAESLKESLQVLEEGKILCLFPEGGITRDSKLQRPMLGIALLALKMEVPIVPVGISGTYEAFNFYHRFPRPKQVTIRFGPPLIFKKEENPSKERLMEVTKEIMDHISRLIAKEGD